MGISEIIIIVLGLTLFETISSVDNAVVGLFFWLSHRKLAIEKAIT
ncbi:MAG: hypothetical protein HY978_02415 [Candidatus Liptonbacteria bacterium]|nr:hypothetical protein [Candidatus Liptonbacteria bacterium]